MRTNCSDIIRFMEHLAPLHLAEDWDNAGLLVGDAGQEVKRIITCLDATSKVIDEAIEKKADMIISHHPFIFKGIKRINQDDNKSRLIYKLIRNNIAVYSAHTNLDIADGGVNECLADKLGLSHIKGLKKHSTEHVYKLAVFVPHDKADDLRDAMSAAGAGWIGKYSDCSFMTSGISTFRPLEGTNPYIGLTGKLEKVNEYRFETIVLRSKLKAVLNAMHKVHPYEEVAYDLYQLEEPCKEYSLGNIGALETPQKLDDFISTVKYKLGINAVKLIGSFEGDIKKVAVFCGSFDNRYIDIIKNSEADVLVTGDVKHHDALDIEELGLCVIDAGHYGTEHIIAKRLEELLKIQFPELEVECNTVEADPIKIC